MITYEIATRDKIEQVTNFIAGLNADRAEQTGWLGTSPEEIREQLAELPYIPFEQSHVLAYEEEQLVGVFGFYGFPEKGLMRLVGPHVKHSAWLDVTQALWQEMLPLVPETITIVKGFTDSQNQKCLYFFQRLGMKQYNAEAIMTLSRAAYAPVELPVSGDVSVVEYSPEHEEAFKSLHPEQSFFTYQEILNLLSDTKKLLLVTENGIAQGYTFAEAFPETGKTDIVQLQVSEQSRNKKYGSLLISHLIKWAFEQPYMTEVGLSVRLENPARRLYERLGFAETHVIVALEKTL